MESIDLEREILKALQENPAGLDDDQLARVCGGGVSQQSRLKVLENLMNEARLQILTKADGTVVFRLA